jgi:RNA polymerase sigma-70 factor (ECF subfamily)
VQRELGWPDESSLLLARPLLDPGPAPDDMLARAELARQVNRALAELTETEREILLMRNVEEMPYREIGCILDLDPAAARKRYGRALLRLRAVLVAAGLIGEQP